MIYTGSKYDGAEDYGAEDSGLDGSMWADDNMRSKVKENGSADYQRGWHNANVMILNESGRKL